VHFMRESTIAVLGGWVLCGVAAMGQAAAAQAAMGQLAARCEGLASVKLDGAHVTSATLEAAGTAIADVKLADDQVQRLKAFCRVKVTDMPSGDSDIKTEVWLPATGWNGRFRGQGNGGFAGLIAYREMAAAVSEGYATAGTDTGHVGGESGFALGHPEKVKDFGWRAVHDMTVQAKALAAAFYGKRPEHSYFTACSDGGREALMEAERFPADYDGILAGAPAYNWTALVSATAQDDKTLMASAAAYLPARKLPAISAAVLAACDAQDGLKDGVLSDPRTCRFDPATLACKGEDSDSCLMPGQVATLKSLYAAKVDAQGKLVFPGYLPGAESARGSWGTWVVGKAQGDPTLMMFFGLGYFRDFVFERKDWSLAAFDFDKDERLATEKTGQELNATDTNLKAFAARGGRLVMYHGWNDPAIPALSSVEYYNGVVGAMGQAATDAMLRLYMVSGMLHCGGGPGATVIGQDGAGPRGDAGNDVFTALETWVEKGMAPATLTAVKYVDDVAAKGVEMARPVCAYPETERYVKGDPTTATSFACVGAKR